MGMAASQARLLALQSRTDSQESKDYLIALNKQALSTQQTELYKEYDQALKSSNNVTQEKHEINDTAEISNEAMALLKNDNNTTVTDVRTAQKTAKLSATRARAINAYRRFAS